MTSRCYGHVKCEQVLNDRHKEILALVCEGKQNKEIGHAVGIAERTVKWYITQLFHRFQVRTRAELIARCANGPGKRS